MTVETRKAEITLNMLSIDHVRDAIASGVASARDFATGCLHQIELRDPAIHAFLSVDRA